MSGSNSNRNNGNNNKKSEMSFFHDYRGAIGATTALVVMGGLAAFVAKRIVICPPHERLIRTGLGIPNMAVSRKGVIWPFQQGTRVSVSPVNTRFELHNMSKEKVQFHLPVSFTVSPYTPEENKQGFENFVQKSAPLSPEKLLELVESIAQGESRILSAGMTVEEMFSDKQKFREMITNSITQDLFPFGLRVDNANIHEMDDLEGNKYFYHMRQRALSDAVATAKTAVADAQRRGEVGEVEHSANARKAKALLEAAAVKIENENRMNIAQSTSELEIASAKFQRNKEIAQVEAKMAAEQRELELKRELEQKRQEQTTARLRAELSSQTEVHAENLIKEAEGVADALRRKANGESDALIKVAEAQKQKSNLQAEAAQFEQERQAEAKLFNQDKEAQMQRIKAEAEADALNKLSEARKQKSNREAEAAQFEQERKAEANLFNEDKEAQIQRIRADAFKYKSEQEAIGLKATADAKYHQQTKEAEAKIQINQAESKRLLDTRAALGQDQRLMHFYLASNTDIYQVMAQESSKALAAFGKKVEVSVWSNGSGSVQGGDGVSSIVTDVIKSMPPLMTYMKQQGIEFPEFLKENLLPSLNKPNIVSLPDTETQNNAK